MTFRLVTGWYPSKNTAEKIFKRVKSKNKNAFIDHDNYSFFIVLLENSNLKKMQIAKKFYLEQGICCGIEIKETTDFI